MEITILHLTSMLVVIVLCYYEYYMNTNILLNNRDLKEYFNMFSLCIYWKLSFF